MDIYIQDIISMQKANDELGESLEKWGGRGGGEKMAAFWHPATSVWSCKANVSLFLWFLYNFCTPPLPLWGRYVNLWMHGEGMWHIETRSAWIERERRMVGGYYNNPLICLNQQETVLLMCIVENVSCAFACTECRRSHRDFNVSKSPPHCLLLLINERKTGKRR